MPSNLSKLPELKTELNDWSSQDAVFISRLFIRWKRHACIILTISPATQHAPNLGVMVAIFAVYVDTQIVNIGVRKSSQLADSHVVLKLRMMGNVRTSWKCCWYNLLSHKFRDIWHILRTKIFTKIEIRTSCNITKRLVKSRDYHLGILFPVGHCLVR